MNPAKPKDLKEKAPDPQSVDVLKEIQEWFQNQCDGEWEHARRITLDSCDNPGWWLKIDLQGTNLENKQFKEIKTGDFSLNMPKPPWIHLYVENGVFNGAGDAMQLKTYCGISWIGPKNRGTRGQSKQTTFSFTTRYPTAANRAGTCSNR